MNYVAQQRYQAVTKHRILVRRPPLQFGVLTMLGLTTLAGLTRIRSLVKC